MCGNSLERLNACRYSDILAKQVYIFNPVQKASAERSLYLIAHKKYSTFRSPEIVLQVMPDTSGFAHSRSRDDDLRRRVGIDQLGGITCLGQIKAGKSDWIDAFCQQCVGLIVKIFMQCFFIYICRLNRKRTVQIDREIVWYKLLFLDSAKHIQELLSAPYGK